MPEPDQLVGATQDNNVEDGWPLYIDRYPSAPTGVASSADDGDLNWEWEWEDDNVIANSNLPLNGADRISRNGEERGSAPDNWAKEEAPESPSAGGNGKSSNGQRHQRTRTKTRSQRRRGRK